MAKIVILGTATSDEIFVGEAGAERPLYPGRRMCGGAPYYTGRALAAAGHEVTPLLALGDDPAGAAIEAACRDAGLTAEGIDVQPGAHSPTCRLLYAPHGDDRCAFDPGDTATTALTAIQLSLIDQADLMVVAATPAARIAQALAQLGPDQRIAWIFKSDPDCFPDAIGRMLVRRAACLFHNRAEADRVTALITSGDASPITFHTRGQDGVIVSLGGKTAILPVSSLAIDDPTGAGDSFAGYALAALLDGASPTVAARHAIDATARFLRRPRT